MNPTRLLSLDLDGTLLGDESALENWRAHWVRWPTPPRPILAYNSGRTVANICRLVAESILPEPDYIIGSVGTEIHDPRGTLDVEAYHRALARLWDLPKVRRRVLESTPATPQPDENQNPFKSSWYWIDAPREGLDQLQHSLDEAGLAARIVYSSGRDLDVVPAAAGKSGALCWLTLRLDLDLDEVLVAGDTANDLDMFELPDVRGVVLPGPDGESFRRRVDPARTYFARSRAAAGLLEGFRALGLIDREDAT